MNICFTGHRPNKIGGYNWNSKKNQEIMMELTMLIILIMEKESLNGKDGFHFICGGALGIDQMAFNICNKLKYTYDNITTEIAVPFLEQDCKWKYEDVLRYNAHLHKSDKVTYVDKLDDYKIKGYTEDIYYPAKMSKRNEYMVDNSDVVIAVWDGTKGGTCNCVNYAKKKGKKIIVLNPNTLEVEIINEVKR